MDVVLELKQNVIRYSQCKHRTQGRKQIPLELATLIDTGATDNNYISDRLLPWLRAHNAKLERDDAIVQSELTNSDPLGTSWIAIVDLFATDDNGKPLVIENFRARVVGLKNYDIIIGLPTIKAQDLLGKMKTQIYGQTPSNILANISTEIFEVLTALSKIPSQLVSLGNVVDKSDLIDYLDDQDDIESAENPLLDKELYDMLQSKPGKAIVTGSIELQRRIQSLIQEYEDVFSTSVDSSPAKVPPMKINVDRSKWELPKN